MPGPAAWDSDGAPLVGAARLGAGPASPETPRHWECVMSKDKGGRAAKKPKATKNIKTTGQTPAAGGAVSATTTKSSK